MAKTNTASIVTLHQPPVSQALSGAERQKNYRLRQKAKKAENPSPVTGMTSPVTSRVTFRPSLLTVTGYALAGVGIVINGYFAKTQGANDLSGYLFLALGILADLTAAAIPRRAAQLWATEKVTSLAAWAIWAMTFAFALNAGIGFTSTNLADVAMTRAGRITPAIASAQASLDDAKAARDRECKGGVGKFCREREAAVKERQDGLLAAQKAVEIAADPQTEAAMRLVAWLSAGTLRPAASDFAMLRLVLFTVLAQIGGVLLMIGRSK